MSWPGDITTTRVAGWFSNSSNSHVLAVEPDRGGGERFGVPVATVFVFDRETGVPQVGADRPEHIGRIEGLHPFAPVAARRSGVTVQGDRAVGADQEPRRDAEALEHRDRGR